MSGPRVGAKSWVVGVFGRVPGRVTRQPGSLELGIEVEHIVEDVHLVVRTSAGEERRHLRLPPSVDVGALHRGLCRGEVVGGQVADQQAVLAQEERVVVPARVAQGGQHLRPDLGVPPAVLVQPVGVHGEREAHPAPVAAHRMPNLLALQTLSSAEAMSSSPSAASWYWDCTPSRVRPPLRNATSSVASTTPLTRPAPPLIRTPPRTATGMHRSTIGSRASARAEWQYKVRVPAPAPAMSPEKAKA